ncbi:PREDICTED: uncharacterized protein LOC104711576 [Camelina sativa]|uniref:Uncharacterized protein LOC104711576 n=1 Tax=Camelina sativa TaxID=90675 RepID=A0ABM0THP3_CAMSA|nr:PREDICTED: uncharacterized protein LOC104711576 [Camelina sativa]
MNELFFQEIKDNKRSHFGFGSLPHFNKSSSKFSDTSSLVMQEELKAANLKILEMEKAQAEQAKAQAEQAKAQARQAKELDYFRKVLFKQFPYLVPPSVEALDGDDN